MPFPLSLGLAGLLFAATALAQAQETPAPQPVEQPALDPDPSPAAADQPQSGSRPDDAPGAIAQALPDPEAAPVTALDDPNVQVEPGDAANGQALAAVCAACHGAEGHSIDPMYPNLAGLPERYMARHLQLYKTGERPDPIMLGFAAPLSAQDMRDLGAYFARQQPVPGVADDTVLVDGPHEGMMFYELGQSLYRGGDQDRGIPACLACHGPAGEGNPGPAYPALAGQRAGYTAAQLQFFRGGGAWGDGENANEVMAGVAANLSDEEIQALATYIEGLHSVASQASLD